MHGGWRRHVSEDREYYDELEVRIAIGAASREAGELVRQIAHAKANAPYYREHACPTSIRRRSPRARLWRGCRSRASPTSRTSRRSIRRSVA